MMGCHLLKTAITTAGKTDMTVNMTAACSSPQTGKKASFTRLLTAALTDKSELNHTQTNPMKHPHIHTVTLSTSDEPDYLSKYIMDQIRLDHKLRVGLITVQMLFLYGIE